MAGRRFARDPRFALELGEAFHALIPKPERDVAVLGKPLNECRIIGQLLRQDGLPCAGKAAITIEASEEHSPQFRRRRKTVLHGRLPPVSVGQRTYSLVRQIVKGAAAETQRLLKPNFS